MAGVTWVALAFGFHLKYALPIALLTGVLEVIPYVGPVVAAAIAASVAISQGGGQMAIGIVVFYTIARQVEDQIVMPQIVGRAVHLHPVATLFAVVCGGAVAGVLGMVLAVPTAAALAVILEDVAPHQKGAAKQSPASESPG
jgi:predicted PurR-regulated permease PerM